jgi:trehalose/maltose transport system substrate-binding protein
MASIWPGILQQYLADLKPYFAKEAASDEPALVTNNTVNGKLVAFPYHTNTGVPFYRADLLKQYGYREPLRTWDQLEKMALRIQQGERAVQVEKER